MRKIIRLVACLAMFLVSAKPYTNQLVRLTIVNKSGLPMEIRLTGSEPENYYYLRVPPGDRMIPSEVTYTIAKDTYTIQPYYIELWDPVYGSNCGGAPGKIMYAYRNIQITFLECGYVPRDKGEPTLIKYSPRWRIIF